jgi:hypothetical protein
MFISTSDRVVYGITSSDPNYLSILTSFDDNSRRSSMFILDLCPRSNQLHSKFPCYPRQLFMTPLFSRSHDRWHYLTILATPATLPLMSLQGRLGYPFCLSLPLPSLPGRFMATISPSLALKGSIMPSLARSYTGDSPTNATKMPCRTRTFLFFVFWGGVDET